MSDSTVIEAPKRVMKLTNHLNLPQPIVDAVANDSYDGPRDANSISVTTLLKPVRIVALERKHAHELEEDASDRIFSLCGQVVHGILERADKTGIAERRLSIEVEGWKVSGQMDRYLDGLLQDYKFVTSYKFKDAGVPEEYEQQLNVYAEILRLNGHPVTKMQIVGILRDWSKMEARRDPAYPQTHIVVRDVPLWAPEKRYQFIRERVILHKKAQASLPNCSDSDVWAKPNIWAVMKRGKERAVKLYGSEAEARTHAGEDASLSVEFRPGQRVRCENYCAVSQFCTQYQQTLSKNGEVA